MSPQSVIVACQCGQRFQAGSHLAGQRVPCPACKQPLVVPSALGTRNAAPPFRPSAAPPSKSTSKLPIIAAVVVVLGGVAVMGMFAAVVIAIRLGAEVESPPADRPASASTMSTGESGLIVEPTLPVPAPKPLVKYADYAPEESTALPQVSPKAELQRRLADQLKAEGEYSRAETAYRKALELEPTYAYASYQLACNYELWGRSAEAKVAFDRAIELGFSDYPVCIDDDELGTIRDLPDFSEKLTAMRTRYLEVAQALCGTPVLFEPAEGVPSKRTAMILLHGYGDTHENYFGEAEAWSELGYHAVAMPGSVPQLSGGFCWSTESCDVTHQQLQAIARHPDLASQVDRVLLLGFSQGAMHAMQLTALHPENYGGVVAISPGGRPWMFDDDYQLQLRKTGRMFFIYGREERLKPAIDLWSDNCRSAGWQVAIHTHAGGHSFPDDWETIRGQAASFLSGE